MQDDALPSAQDVRHAARSGRRAAAVPAEPRNGSPAVLAFGTSPPPVTGMTLLTQQMIQGLRQAGPLTYFDWSTGISRRGFKFRAARVTRILGSFLWLLRHGRVRNTRVYVVANSKVGLYLTGVLVFLARQLGYQIFLHHHTYYYIDSYDWRVAWINRIMGPTGVHVVHCERMARDFAAVYTTKCSFAFVYPSIVSSPLGRPRNAPARPFRLGHLSNLQVAKGLDHVLAVFRDLRRQGRDVRLTLAGPYHTAGARGMVEQALAEFPGLIQYVGPVYAEQKAEFFNEVDCFLFPTRSESWGIVLNEAMAAGLPVITYDRGCTQTVVGDKAGLLVRRDADFASAANIQLARWMDHPDEYRAASQAAIEQAAFLHEEANRMLDRFAAQIFSADAFASNASRS